MTLVQTEPKKIYLWTNEVKWVFYWDTKVRPATPPYLCFTANTAGSTVKLQKYWSPTSVTLETSTDWNTWNTYTFWNTLTLSNVWDKVYRRNTSETTTGFSTDSSNYYYFSMTWKMSWSGDINYLLNKNSADTLGNYGYNALFADCTSLTSAPDLTATTIGQYSYRYMFSGCSNLVSAPKISATTIGRNCCEYMFNGCSNLEELPWLPAITLERYCYYYMFRNCSKIKLSATQTWEYQTPYRVPIEWTWVAANNCIQAMFYGTWWVQLGDINTTYYTSNTVV